MTSNETSNWLNRLINKIVELFSGKNQQGSRVIEEQKDLKTKRVISKTKQEVALQEEIEVTKDEKPNLELFPNDSSPPSSPGELKVSPETEKQFRSQSHTSSKEFRIPILQALVNLGGSAKRKLVFDELEKIMGDQLSDNDREPLPSRKRVARWQRIATNTRTKMRDEGYITVDPNKGVWIITEKGRAFLDTSQYL